ncbi:hypothetical protein GW17_00017560 [Ensete ventricosum]|nr:hypothetical protein GW17_00017560 [Ensete ventricosum]
MGLLCQLTDTWYVSMPASIAVPRRGMARKEEKKRRGGKEEQDEEADRKKRACSARYSTSVPSTSGRSPRGEKNRRFFSPRSLDDVVEASCPHFLSSRESGDGSPNSPSSSFSLLPQLILLDSRR